jgi:aminopeptidase N
MAHPIRPESYIEMNNFYTATVYNKGAEVIRMIHTLLGKELFRKGMDLYFERFDGKAVTTEDFVKAMEDAGGIDLTQFRLWYCQAGTPKIFVNREYDSVSQTYSLTLEQKIPDTPGQKNKSPMLIPVKTALLDENGHHLPLILEPDNGNEPKTETVLHLRKTRETFIFKNIPKEPVPSLFRGFSAPVSMNATYCAEELMFLMAHETDEFNRWEAGQVFITDTILQMVDNRTYSNECGLPSELISAFRKILTDASADKALIAQILTIPSESEIGDKMTLIDVDGIHWARDCFMDTLARELYPEFKAVFTNNRDGGPYRIDTASMARRKLKNLALSYLARVESDKAAFVFKEFESAGNMTDELSALSILVDMDHELKKTAVDRFYEKWKKDTLVLDKWFSVQASSVCEDTYDTVVALTRHADFSIRNPNKVRSLIGMFCQGNPLNFHRKDGKGYRFLGDRVIELDKINTNIASRMASGFNRWKRYDDLRKELMKDELVRIINTPNLSTGVFEIVSKALD